MVQSYCMDNSCKCWQPCNVSCQSRTSDGNLQLSMNFRLSLCSTGCCDPNYLLPPLAITSVVYILLYLSVRVALLLEALLQTSLMHTIKKVNIYIHFKGTRCYFRVAFSVCSACIPQNTPEFNWIVL